MKNSKTPISKMKINFYLILIFNLIFISKAFAQTDSTKKTVVGLSTQIYPAGLIATIHTELFYNKNTSLFFRAGGNFADRKDFSPFNDNEKGNGFGGSAGYRKYINLKKGNILLGSNLDVWNMWIDWKNNIGQPNQTQGRTYTLVLQPWLEAGYFISVNKSPIEIGITTGFGREINVITNGKPVGQGWIGSVSLVVQFARFKQRD